MYGMITDMQYSCNEPQYIGADGLPLRRSRPTPAPEPEPDPVRDLPEPSDMFPPPPNDPRDYPPLPITIEEAEAQVRVLTDGIETIRVDRSGLAWVDSMVAAEKRASTEALTEIGRTRIGARDLFAKYDHKKHKVLMAYLNGELTASEIDFAADLFDEDELHTISAWHRSRAQWHREQAALIGQQAAETRATRGIRIRNSSQEQSSEES